MQVGFGLWVLGWGFLLGLGGGGQEVFLPQKICSSPRNYLKDLNTYFFPFENFHPVLLFS